MPFVNTGDAEVWWEEQGGGSPLLLIQGLGFPGALWYRVLPALSATHRVLALDNRGTGRTTTGAGPYPIEAMAADALAVLDAGSIDKAHVLGISMGGLIAQELALSAPHRVASLILAATHPGGAATVLPDPDVLQLLYSRSDLPLEESYRATIPVAYAPSTAPEVIDADIAARLEQPTSSEGYMGQLTGGMAYQGSIPRIEQLRIPTLCVHGTLDKLVPPQNSEILASAIPGARIQWLDGAAHMLFSDAPDAFAEVIVTFTAATQVDA